MEKPEFSCIIFFKLGLDDIESWRGRYRKKMARQAQTDGHIPSLYREEASAVSQRKRVLPVNVRVLAHRFSIFSLAA